MTSSNGLPNSERAQPVAKSTAFALETKHLTTGYAERTILDDLTVSVRRGDFTVIIGANASGKSTLLRSFARLLPPRSGQVLLDGTPITKFAPKQLAQQLGLLPQQTTVPPGITVSELVSRGRHPHQGVFRRWSPADEAAVRHALEATHLVELRGRTVDELSGGQRQRVLIAMVLAQETEILLLDEPTTFLDISHQIEVLELAAELHRSGRTLVAVLHDLNQAARYASNLIVMKHGRILATGNPNDILTSELVAEAFSVRARILQDPETGTPLVVPLPGMGAVVSPPNPEGASNS
ncbi:ABC transporter ATP-binding protein [Humidisolicoccus flavus]|uniref:ABC transporter ATP-binding protein n=1 Tax=Humidisolicoccus flavus TaxID=3111414 RepID=UPI0032470E08